MNNELKIFYTIENIKTEADIMAQLAQHKKHDKIKDRIKHLKSYIDFLEKLVKEL